MSAVELASRLFSRARALELTEVLPELSGLPSARLDAIQAGQSFSASEFEALCRALAVDASAMYRGDDTQPNRMPVRFRAALDRDRPDGRDLRLLALAVEQGRILAHLQGLLDAASPLLAYRRVHPPEATFEAGREGYELGARARQALLPEPTPLRDLEGWLHQQGVHVAHVSFSTPDIDAASLWEPGAAPIVLLNRRSRRYAHPGALRATLAHELCHLLHDGGAQHLLTQLSWGDRQGNFAEAVEVRARGFAPAFLAPPTWVRAWADALPGSVRDTPRRLTRALAERWGFSFEGAVWHAKNCGLYTPKVADGLLARPGKSDLDLRPFEHPHQAAVPRRLDPALPERVAEPWEGYAAELVLRALEADHLSVGRARELLTWG